MTIDEHDIDGSSDQNPERQFPSLTVLLRAITTTRKLTSLYGVEHPNAVQGVESLAEVISDFASGFERPTCVFTKNAVVVNEHYYESSSESVALYERLKSRGVMAITITGPPSVEQVRGFLAFLNTEPSEIRRVGGASAYLRKHSITRIVATEAIYSSGDFGEEPTADLPENNSRHVERSIAAVIGWLTKQDEDDEEIPRLPTLEILSDPDMAAKLIREAVTKLHASRREAPQGELVGEVVQDLKDIAGDSEGWDKVAPQVRKALTKLPEEMRSSSYSFMTDINAVEIEGSDGIKAIDMSEVEDALAARVAQNESDSAPDLEYLSSLFGVKTNGIPRGWHTEMESSSVTKSAGNTYVTLMVWEKSPSEHSRITQALAALISEAVAADEHETALQFAGALAQEVSRQTDDAWRTANARSALMSLDQAMLKLLVVKALKDKDYQHKETAASIVEAVPDVALDLVEFLGLYDDEKFGESLKRGIITAGQNAVPYVGMAMRQGSVECKKSSLGILVGMGTTSAVKEIADAMESDDLELVTLALEALPAIRLPQVTSLCIRMLSHKSPEVRKSAMAALGKVADETAMRPLVRIASSRGLSPKVVEERVAAIEALGRIGGDEVCDFLVSIVQRRSWFGRVKYEPIRLAAEKAVRETAKSKSPTEPKAA
jgi:hypothetical protein